MDVLAVLPAVLVQVTHLLRPHPVHEVLEAWSGLEEASHQSLNSALISHNLGIAVRTC